MRVDRVASLLFDDHSRMVLTRAIEDGFLTLDGSLTKPSYRVHGSEVLRLDLAETPRVEDLPQSIPLDICHEDDDVIVLDDQRVSSCIPGPAIRTGRSLTACWPIGRH